MDILSKVGTKQVSGKCLKFISAFRVDGCYQFPVTRMSVGEFILLMNCCIASIISQVTTDSL